MSRVPPSQLVCAFSRPQSLDGMDLPGWELLVRQGRAAEVLGILDSRLARVDMSDVVPERPRDHMRSAAVLARRQHVELGYEVREIQSVLAGAGVHCVLLKGAAYVLMGLRAAEGRLVSDVDILVPLRQLPLAESCLMKAGWISTTTDIYDQHYYRTWMHEIPALRHVHRGAVLDVHHSVVPPTAGYGLDVALMLDAAVAIPGLDKVLVLCDVDMVIHSAVHLMHEGELEMGFRGLVDLDALVTEFTTGDAAFWRRLAARAVQLHLQRPTFLALRYMHRLLGTPLDAAGMAALQAQAGCVGRVRLAVLDALYDRALRPHHASLDDRFSGLARWLLYVRSHLLRMPLHLLLPHLARKAWKGLVAALAKKDEANDAEA